MFKLIGASNEVELAGKIAGPGFAAAADEESAVDRAKRVSRLSRDNDYSPPLVAVVEQDAGRARVVTSFRRGREVARA